MPVPSSTVGPFITTYKTARSIPEDVWQTLRSNARNANVILPQALKVLAAEQTPGFRQDNVWVICTGSDGTIRFILSCTEGYMGSYPIFIMTTLPFDRLGDEQCQSGMHMLARALGKEIPVHRAYSVFAPEPLAVAFSNAWTMRTGIASYNAPYYAANITYCTKSSFVNKQTSLHPDYTYEIRPAVEGDVDDVAEGCFGFAAVSVGTISIESSSSLTSSSLAPLRLDALRGIG